MLIIFKFLLMKAVLQQMCPAFWQLLGSHLMGSCDGPLGEVQESKSLAGARECNL